MNPPVTVKHVLDAVMMLFNEKDLSWGHEKHVMGNIDGFIQRFCDYDKDHIPNSWIKKTKSHVKEHNLTPELVKATSCAAEGLCTWVTGII